MVELDIEKTSKGNVWRWRVMQRAWGRTAAGRLVEIMAAQMARSSCRRVMAIDARTHVCEWCSGVICHPCAGFATSTWDTDTYSTALVCSDCVEATD